MAHKETHTEHAAKPSPFNVAPAEFAATAKRRLEELANAQMQLFNGIQQTNRQWLDRVQAEADLASEFASKLTAARSIPDAMTACQEWGSRRFELMAEDARHLMDDTQKFMQQSADILATGWQPKAVELSS